MTGMNRTLEDGRPVLIDGSFPMAHNIHGTLNAWSPETIEDDRAYADLRATQAFLATIEGEWELDVERTKEESTETPVGEVTGPIVVVMGEGGAFELSVEEINVNEGTLQLSLDGRGRIEVEPTIVDDRLVFDLTVRDFEVTRSDFRLAGMSLPDPAEMIEGIVGASKAPQQIELRHPEPGLRELFIIGDINMYILRQRSVPRRRILSTPRALDQAGWYRCWAGALGCFLRLLRTEGYTEFDAAAGVPRQGKGGDGNPFPEYEIEAIVERVRRYEKDNRADINQAFKYLGKDDRLDRTPNSFNVVSGLYGVKKGKAYPKGTFTIQMVKEQIDQGKYCILAHSEPKWGEPPAWHAVVAYGYDLDQNKAVIADSNGAVLGAFYIHPDFQYFMTAQSPDIWDAERKEWLSEPRSDEFDADKAKEREWEDQQKAKKNPPGGAP